MIWLQGAALAGLAVVAIPALVHLLIRRRAPRVLFPSLRFLLPTATIAIRLRAISDWPLLLIRVSVFALAAVAFAQPLMVTAQRRAAWNARLTRAIVVDTSASMTYMRGAAAAAAGTEARPTVSGTAPGSIAGDTAPSPIASSTARSPIAGGTAPSSIAGRAAPGPNVGSAGVPAGGPPSQTAPPRARLMAIVERIRKESWRYRVFETPALRSGIDEAVAHLGQEPPARREIVVVSDFQQGALTDRDLRSVPPGIGVRFERMAAAPADRTALGWPLLLRDAEGVALWAPLVFVDPAGTRVTYQRVDKTSPPQELSVVEVDGQRRVRIDSDQRPGSQTAGDDQTRPLHPNLPITFLVSPADRAAADALLPFAAGVGVPQVQSSGWRAFIALGKESRDRDEEPLQKAVRPTGWVGDVLARLVVDRDLRDIAAQIDVESVEDRAGTATGVTNSITENGTWTTIVRDRSGAAIVHGAATLLGDAPAARPALLVVTKARADSFLALALTHALLRAMGAGTSLTESEVASIPDADLARWTRAAPEVTQESYRHADQNDARWVWTAVLILLGLEALVRRERRKPMAAEEDRHAA